MEANHEDVFANSQRLTIHTTLEDLVAGAFALDVGSVTSPTIQLQVFVPYQGSTTETRLHVSRELLQLAPQAKKFIGNQVIDSIRKLT